MSQFLVARINKWGRGRTRTHAYKCRRDSCRWQTSRYLPSGSKL